MGRSKKRNIVVHQDAPENDVPPIKVQRTRKGRGQNNAGPSGSGGAAKKEPPKESKPHIPPPSESSDTDDDFTRPLDLEPEIANNSFQSHESDEEVTLRNRV